ncbi:LysR family transcriptional regulator [Novosphingobium decolorationis]|uniref:LysR family transcriptional regulator n=1 Tax=Novosphingobium decolorationis TaxID=2698673 RepID=A0ABX8EC31_9SPHN|nr:LysR substrate-binding domain-containing protein [Novosphingobium decolorationis]QVM85721.1 LysR family transcriptional regulator [Novosphingobium decolorationis]
MKLRHIEVFHAVYTTGSVSKAARQLNVSQPAATNLLRHAEDLLGFPLFDRVRGRLVPTADAHELIAQADEIQAQVHHFREIAQNLRRGRGQVLRIATLPALGVDFLPRAVAEYVREHPGVVIDLSTSHHDEMAAKLYKRETDLVICYSLPRGTPVASVPLGEAEMVALFREEDFPDAPDPLPLEALEGLSYVSTSDSGPQARLVANELAARGIELEPVASSRSYAMAAAMVRAGMGATIVDQHTALGALRPGLTIRPLEPRQPYMIQAAHLEGRPPSRLALDFLDHVRARLGAGG